MRVRIEKLEDGSSKTVWVAEPGDLPITGTSSDGRHTTFSTNGKHHFSARNIHEDEAFWLAAVLPCISAACIAWVTLGISFERPHPGPFFLLSLVGVTLLASGIREGASTWKEMLFLVTTVLLFGNGTEAEVLWLAGGTYGFLLIRYAWLWRERAVWEPFVFLTLFCGALLVNRSGILPDQLMMFAFICIASGSFVGLLTVLTSGWTYSRGYNSISE